MITPIVCQTFSPFTSMIGKAGPSSLGFHISSSNSTNIPNQLDDNMDANFGNGNALVFLDLAVAKTHDLTVDADSDSVYEVPAGVSFTYSVTVTNTSTEDTATGVSLNDLLPAGVSLLGASASQGSYNTGSGLWDIGTLAPSTTVTLVLEVSGINTLAIHRETNTANNLLLNEADTDSTNNIASVNVDILPVDALQVSKSSSVLDDGLDDSSGFHIPGARVQYSIVIANNSTADVTDTVLSDVVPDNTTYVSDSIAIDGVPKTDNSGDSDGDSYNALTNEISVQAGTINSGGDDVVVTFEVSIN